MTCQRCDTPTEAELAMCQSCVAYATRAITATPGILAAMHTTIAKQDRVQDGTRTGKSLHAPPPANIDAIEKKHKLRAALYNAALAVGHASGVRPPVHLGPFDVAVWLAPMADWLGHDDDTAAEGLAFLSAYRAATLAIDLPRERIDIGECTEGECPERLTPMKGQRTIVCPKCGTVWDVQDRRDATFEAARHVLMPAAELARTLTAVGYRTTPKTVEHWVARGTLEAALCNVQRKQQLYRFSDGHAVAKRLAEKRARVASRSSTK